MRIDICVVLISAFIEKNQIWLAGSPGCQFAEVYSVAQDNGDEEIMACLDRVDELGMVEHCFSEL